MVPQYNVIEYKKILNMNNTNTILYLSNSILKPKIKYKKLNDNKGENHNN